MNQDIKVTVDAVICTRIAQTISVLLIKRKNEPYKGQWAIPGGFVENEESLDDAIKRELYEETGLKINHLKQFYTFGKPNRDPRQRIISVAYYADIISSKHNITPSSDAQDAKWFQTNELPKLSFDHDVIIKKAINYIK